MAQVRIISVSAQAAKRSLERIVSENGMIYSSNWKSASSSTLSVMTTPRENYIDKNTGWWDGSLPLEEVVLSSNYWSASKLKSYAEKVAGKGEVKIISE